MNDDELLRAARSGDAVAIERLLARHQPDVRRFARRVCTTEDADDAVQHTLVQMSTYLGTFVGVVHLTRWLFTVVKRECIRLINRARRIEPPTGDPVSARSDADLALALEQALARLDPDLRDVVLLRDVEQRSGPEVAAALGITLAAMKSRLHRGREVLRRALTD